MTIFRHTLSSFGDYSNALKVGVSFCELLNLNPYILGLFNFEEISPIATASYGPSCDRKVHIEILLEDFCLICPSSLSSGGVL